MTVCAVDLCDLPARARGWCNRHYAVWYRFGAADFVSPLPWLAGKNGERLKPPGSRTLTANGYIQVKLAPDHPFFCMTNGSGGWLPEHRLVMATHLGRPLEKYENVHHRNGVKDDNRIENLELWKTPQPSGQRPSDLHCPGCRCSE